MISENSRYVDTKSLSQNGKTYWGIWERPDELWDALESLGYKEHRVAKSEIGCLDVLAVKYFGNERLGWFIAAFNNIIDPVTDMYVGQVLRIPDILFVQRFATRS